AAHQYPVNQAVGTVGHDRDALCEVPGGESVDRPIVVCGQDTQRLGNGISREAGQIRGERGGDERAAGADDGDELVESDFGLLVRAGETDQVAVQIHGVIAAFWVVDDG